MDDLTEIALAGAQLAKQLGPTAVCAYLGGRALVAASNSPAALVLLEKISSAVGVWHRPSAIVNEAKAEGEARRILAAADDEIQKKRDLDRALLAAEICDKTNQMFSSVGNRSLSSGILADGNTTEIARRAALRFVAEQTRQQENIEAITADAMAKLDHEAKPDQLDNDWIVNFFDKSRHCSDEQMQSLWAKILAGEANSPGKFSRRTVNLMADFGKADAEAVSTIRRFCLEDTDGKLIPLVFNHKQAFFKENGLSFDLLHHLSSIGVITFSMDGYYEEYPTDVLPVRYLGTNLALGLSNPRRIEVGQILFTDSGKDLASLCNVPPVPGFLEFVLDHLKGHGVVALTEQEAIARIRAFDKEVDQEGN